jgi:cell division protein ZapA
MAEIDVVIAGRTYRLGCEDGQEQHLAGLAAGLDADARAVAGATGALQEGKVLVMAALMVADRLHEATEALRRAERALQSAGSGDDATGAIDAALDRLEKIVATAEAVR